MKKNLLSVLAVLAGLGTTRAADPVTLYASNLGSGITAQGGATAVAQGTIRFGTFPAGFDFAGNAENFPALDAAFTEVHSVSGPISALSTNGFFDIEQAIATSGAYEGKTYDLSASSTADVANDIAGEKIYIWILNNTTPSAATQQAVFSSNQTWPDRDLPLATDVTVSTDIGTAGLTAHLGVLGGGANIGGGAASHAMGGATEIPSAVVATRTPLTETVLVGTGVTFSFQAEGTPPFTQQWFKVGNGTAIGTGSTLTIANPQLTDDGEYYVVVTNSAGNATSNNVALDVITVIPTVEDQPDPLAVKVGGSATFSVVAKGAGTLSYKWLKGSAPVPGGTQPSLTLYGLALADAAAYRCEVSNVVAGKTNKVLSNTAQLTIVQDNVPPAVIAARASATASVTLTLNYAENGVAANGKAALQWLKDGQPIAGAITKTLKITPLTISVQAPLYTCQVTPVGAAAVTGASTFLRVYDSAPEFAFEVPNTPNMGTGKVGRVYTYQIPVDAAVNKAPASFDATGLPPGLVINKATGLISGKPTKSGTYNKIVLKLNSPVPQGNRSIAATLIISDLPENIAGTYVGPVERINVLGADLGGKLDNLVVATTGAISGKLILGAASWPLVGAVTVNPNTDEVTASISVKRLISQAPLTITFKLGANLLSNGNITDGEDEVFFKGWRNKWLATPAASSAAAYVATYNIAIGLDDGDVNATNPLVPQGYGYASFPVKADGKLAFTGKLADGTGVTGATFVGPNGEVFMFQTLYTNKGSFLGDLTIDSLDDANPVNNEILGDGSWSAPVNTAAANKLYRDGFNFELSIAGGAYVAPASKTLFGLAANEQVDLAFEEGNIAAFLNPDATVTVLANNKVTVVPTNAAAKTTLTFTPASGLFTGGFEAVAKKKTTFFGLIVPITGVQQGLGYFLLDQTGTPATQRSGAVFLEAPEEEESVLP
ncbi:MAG: immunoglobulin domain-containing protein [Verrucomicrobiota bacterium]